jgi:hypothetical protein
LKIDSTAMVAPRIRIFAVRSEANLGSIRTA